MSKKERFAAPVVRSLSVASHIQGESKEPKTIYAKKVLENHDYKFIREYVDAISERRFVEVKVPSRNGEKVLVKWSFDPKGEAMRKRALERHVREPLFSRSRIQRFPRQPRFPRYTKKWAKKLGLLKGGE
jgi:hypothetical protein